jgi:hypothetical protein
MTKSPFNLSDYRVQLTPYRREKGKYFCPACGGHNLSFSRDGHWNCWNDPTREHRLEIMAALLPDFGKPPQPPRREFYPQRVPKVYPTQLHYPIAVPMASIAKRWLCQIAHPDRLTTLYQYSDRQRLIRHDYRHHKSIYPQYRDKQGKWINGAGNQAWPVFGLGDLFPYPGKVNLVVIVEGPKCVGIARSRGIPALCLEAGDYRDLTILSKLATIERKLDPLFLAILPDADPAGERSGKRIWRVARQLGIPATIFKPSQIQANLSLGADIEQLLDLDGDKLMAMVKAKLR